MIEPSAGEPAYLITVFEEGNHWVWEMEWPSAVRITEWSGEGDTRRVALSNAKRAAREHKRERTKTQPKIEKVVYRP